MPKNLLFAYDHNKSPQEQAIKPHNRWHPDIPMAAKVNPGDVFRLECVDWTGGQVSNNDSADDIRDVELEHVHYLSGPIHVEGAEPGDLLVVDLLDITMHPQMDWGFTGIFARENGGGFLVEHYPEAKKAIWDYEGIYAKSRHIEGVRFPGLVHPGLIGCLPSREMLDMWNKREAALISTDPDRVPPLASAPTPVAALMGEMSGALPRGPPKKAPAPFRRASMAAIAISRTCRPVHGYTSRYT